MIRNLSDETIEQLTEYFNENVWVDQGELPAEWREAKIILIPKPGKPLEISKRMTYIANVVCRKAL